jgi:hypothetical protein
MTMPLNDLQVEFCVKSIEFGQALDRAFCTTIKNAFAPKLKNYSTRQQWLKQFKALRNQLII